MFLEKRRPVKYSVHVQIKLDLRAEENYPTKKHQEPGAFEILHLVLRCPEVYVSTCLILSLQLIHLVSLQSTWSAELHLNIPALRMSFSLLLSQASLCVVLHTTYSSVMKYMFIKTLECSCHCSYIVMQHSSWVGEILCSEMRKNV